MVSSASCQGSRERLRDRIRLTFPSVNQSHVTQGSNTNKGKERPELDLAGVAGLWRLRVVSLLLRREAVVVLGLLAQHDTSR
jgi:hypothetical protein